MKSHQFEKGASVLLAMVAMGVGIGCGAEATENAAPDFDMIDTALEPEGWSDGDFDDWFGDDDWRYRPRIFQSDLLGASVVPAYPALGLEAMAYGRGSVRFSRNLDNCGLEDRCSQLQFSVCGLNDVSYIDVTGLRIHEGAVGVVSPTPYLDAAIDIDRPRRYGVIGGCAGGYLAAKTCDGCLIDESFDKLRTSPENFYYDLRTVRHPGGLVRGQLRARY